MCIIVQDYGNGDLSYRFALQLLAAQRLTKAQSAAQGGANGPALTSTGNEGLPITSVKTVDINDIEALGSQKKATPLSQRKGQSGSSRGSTLPAEIDSFV
jgi:hypothetical protein